MKDETGRCEGRKPFGSRPGEAEAIAFARDYRKAGHSWELVAAALNQSQHKTRMGKPWIGATVRNILERAK